jgi:O-antigen ligase
LTGALFYIVLVLCVAAALFRQPGPILCASIFLMPMTQAMPQVGVLFVPINLILIGLAIVPPQPAGSIKDPRRLPLRALLLILSITLIIGLLIRTIGQARGDFFVTTYVEAVRHTWGMLTAFVVYALMFRQLSRMPPSMTRLMVGFCQLSVGAEGLVAIVDHLRGVERATGYLGESNSAGAYFSSSVAFFLAYTLFATMGWRVLYLVGMLLGLSGVVDSISRGAMVATVTSCALVLAIFFTATRKRTGTKLLVIVAVVFIAVNATMLIPQRTIDRALVTFGGSVPQGEEEETKIDDSSHQRLMFWVAGWNYFKDWPLGYGTDTFPQLNEAVTGYRKVAHNVYVNVAVENGIQGFLALLAMVFGVFVYLGKQYVRAVTDEKRALALGLIGWWAAHCFAHFFITAFFDVLIIGQFWMMLACLACMESPTPLVRAPATRPASS